MSGSNTVQDRWSSHRVFVLATAGAAIGLGNVWKFPYMLGSHGGSAFLLVYLLCVFTIGMPLMMAEALIGRYGAADPVTSLETIGRQFQVPGLTFFAWWGAAGLILILSFYSILAGWCIAYFIRMLGGTFEHATAKQIHTSLTHLLASPTEMVLWHSLFLGMTCYVVRRGIREGLERYTRILMPTLLFMLLIMVIYALSTGDVPATMRFLFTFNRHLITADTVISAMGHAFFTLALGAGAIIAYGSYAPRMLRLGPAILAVTCLDTVVALLAGLAIFPITFSQHVLPNEGPTLIFDVIPLTFSTMFAGRWLGACFFCFLIIAAWTSSINLLEPLVEIAQVRYGWSRKHVLYWLAPWPWLLGLCGILSFNALADIKPIAGLSLFDIMTILPDRIILPVGGLGFAFIASWVMSELCVMQTMPFSNARCFKVWRVTVRYIAMPAVLCVLVYAAW